MKIYLLLLIIPAFPFNACNHHKDRMRYNEEASVVASMPFNPMEQKVISMAVDKNKRSMFILYGNEVAYRAAGTGKTNPYPAGSILYFVTWRQEEDDHWFGGRIPGQFQSAEIVRFDTGSLQPQYEYIDGATGRTGNESNSTADSRISYIVSRKPLVIP